ncbi:MAG: hypothetical protein AABY26_01435, partial [Nanoarchaeota archaeon]
GLEKAVDEETVDIGEDVIADDPLDVQLTLEEREKYLGPLARAQGKSFDRIEAVLAEKEINVSKDGKFYRHLPERDGSLKGEEILITDLNDMLADVFAAERLPIVTEATVAAEKKAPAALPVVPGLDETSPVIPDPHDHIAGDWFDKGPEIGKETPHPDTNGFDKAIADTGAAKPEDIMKRPWYSYAAVGIGIAFAAGAIYTIGYVAGESGKIKTVTQTVVDNTLVEQLSGQLASQREELETAYADNDNLNDGNYLATRENDNLVSELGMLSNQLEQKDTQYAALEQQLSVAPDAQEANALREKNSALEIAREQASIKAQEAERKYGQCVSAKDVCESSRKTELDTCNRYAADRDVGRVERDNLIAERYGITFDWEDCLIAEGAIAESTPSIIYTDRIVEKEVPVEKIVEKEVPTLQECPTLEELEEAKYGQRVGPAVCPPPCPGVDIVCSEVQEKYDTCVKDKAVAVQAQEETADDLAVCGVYKGQLQFAFDSCIGELGRIQDALGKKNIESANAALQASRVLGETKEQLAQVQKNGEHCSREYQTLDARIAGSNYERIKADSSQVMTVAEDYVRRAGGMVQVEGSNCDTALRNFSGLITGNIHDANVEQIIVENTRGICGKIDPKKNYIQIKVKK